MIQEIINFIDHLEDKSPDIFKENLELKEGIYVFLEKEGDELVVKDKNVLKVDKETERNEVYEQFLQLAVNTEMLNAMKSFNSGPKVYIAIGSPFGISLNAKAYKKNGDDKLLYSAEAYFKAARKYLDEKNEQHDKWCTELEYFVKTKMIDFLASDERNAKAKDQFMFYFFMKEPELKDYQEIQNRFLSEKLFNKDKFNIELKSGDIYGIADSLSGFNDSKEFLKHKTAPIELNYRVDGLQAQKLFSFFQLQQKNKILPNPFPLFVDEAELSGEAVKFYNKDKKAGHKEIVEELLKTKDKLQNYYLIYFNNREKGSRIIDLDFVPVFEHKLKKSIKIKSIFQNSKKDIHFEPIETIFDLEELFHKYLFLQYKKDSSLGYGILRKNFFSDKIEASKGYFINGFTTTLLYKYRKAIYDYVYKSRRDVFTSNAFYEIMSKLIIEDLRNDKYDKQYKSHSFEKNIKIKLNIWFSLYDYFANSKNKEDMVNKTEQLLEKLKTIANPENTGEHIKEDAEFAFASGQLIRMILNKSESGERSHALLEPFLQKTQCDKLKLAIARAFDTYKHAFKFYKGDANRYEFDKIMSDVMGFETNTNMKELLPMILAGYFSETIFKKEKEAEKPE